MSGIFDRFVPVIGARVRSDFRRAVEQADTGRRSEQGQGAGAAHGLGVGRHVIVIEIETDEEGLIGLDGADQVASEGVSGKGKQMRLLFREDFGHGARVIAGPRALVGDLVAPGEGLAVEIFQGGEGTGSEEARAYVLDGSLDAPFLISPSLSAGSRGEVIVGGEFQEARMEVDGVAAALQNDAAKVVGLQRAGCPTPVVKGVDVTEEKTLERLVEEEFQPQGAAVRKGQDEGGETAVGTPDHHLAEVGPVGLSLLPGESAETEKSFAAQGAEFSHDATKLGEAAGVTAGANHLEE